MRGLWMLPRRLQIHRLHKFLFMLFIVFIITFYLTVNKQDDDDCQYFIWGPCNEPNEVSDEKYLVWNSKCHMLSMSPNDSSIKRFIKKEEFETCSTKPLLSSLSRSNGGIYLLIDHDVMAEHYGNLSCCWAEVTRGPPSPKSSKATNFDSVISVGKCQNFKGQVLLHKNIQVVYIVCRREDAGTGEAEEVYKNVHAVIDSRIACNALLFE